MIMKHTLYLLIVVLISILSVSCSEERLAGNVSSSEFEEGELVLASLHLSVNGFEVNVQSGSRAPEDEPTQEELAGTDEENAIHNIWVFQFDTNGDQLINPRYYEIDNQAELQDLKVWLKPGVASTVYVVANTGNSTWGTQRNFSDINLLLKQTLPSPNPQQLAVNSLSIPMNGSSNVVTISESSNVEIKVTRMYAKLQIKVNITPSDMSLYNIQVNNIPWICQIESYSKENEEAAEYPVNTPWITRTFVEEQATEIDGEPYYVIYVPENIQGETNNSEQSPEEKTNDAPKHALALNMQISRTNEEATEHLNYTVYPGANNYNNFNLKRNSIYLITINITSENTEQHVPSSNCFVVIPGNRLAFEPYYRIETGGGYNFKEYLDAEDETGKKVIESVKILWQTKDAIGDNSEGNLVQYNKETQKIYVQTQKEGNALIAAYNQFDEIIWSWHIWITDHDPGNVGNAIVYTTYDWDNEGIDNKTRVPGYAIMPCNLGALANEPENSQDTKPYGMLYQWGRKDPFPPLKRNNTGLVLYSSYYMNEDYYDNSNKIVVNNYATTENYVFTSMIGTEIEKLGVNPLLYAIQHPTVFMCGTKEVEAEEPYVENLLNYFADGDWTHCHDDKLWGGLEPKEEVVHLTVVESHDVHIYKNYGTEKSIFDPCPYGWRVPPGDLWLGFTNDGLNPSPDNEGWSEINYYKAPGWNAGYNGMYIYLEDWQQGRASYFPNQGTRVGNGMGIRVGSCGNYHNATADEDERVNILHIHNAPRYFHIFEYEFPMYYVKSVAGPIRCVRDRR